MSLVPKHIKNLLPYEPGKSIDFIKRKYNINRIPVSSKINAPRLF